MKHMAMVYVLERVPTKRMATYEHYLPLQLVMVSIEPARARLQCTKTLVRRARKIHLKNIYNLL